MKKLFLVVTASLILLSTRSLFAANGDTTYLKVFNTVSFNHYGNFDQWGVFPSSDKKFQRIFMKYTVSCESNGQCEWDYTNTIFVRNNTHTKDSSLLKATTFTVNGAVKDSFNYSTDTTWTNSFNAITKRTDSIPSTALTIIHYHFVNALQPQVPIDTIKVWPVQYYRFRYDTAGKKIDSIFVAVKQTVRAIYTNYYSVFDKIIDYEMGRMITPYAKLNTLPRPFAYEYVYDVTDYASMLHDSVQIRMNYSGYSWGFTGTIEFFMIQGTPAREAYKVENLWNGYFAYGKPSDPIENHLPAKSFIKTDTTGSVKLRMTITGHGSDSNGCCEFMPSNYYLKLNNVQFAQNTIWKDDCGSNPIINQGGTWVYNRGNWCPGMIIKPYEYNLNAVKGTDSIDVNMDSYISNTGGGYAYGTQLIYYKNNMYGVDAGIETILSPTTDFLFNRSNPICDNAKIVIRNFGSQALTSALIKYQIGDGIPQSYLWSGNLNYDEKTEVVLPSINWVDPSGVKNFTVWIDKANQQTDENPFNNLRSTTFQLPAVLPFSFIIETHTNNNPGENSYTVSTWWGKTIFYKKFALANTVYRDTFNLGFGCYSFNFIDSAGDGLQFWNNASQGAGSVRFMKNPESQATPTLKSFNTDFGNFLNFNFRTVSQVAVEEVSNISSYISIYPQPANDRVVVKSDKININKIQLISLDGRITKSFSEVEIAYGTLNISDIPAGIYLLNISTSTGEQCVKKLAVVK